MSITNVSSARRAGYKITDNCVDKNAAIDMSKIGTRTLYIPLCPAEAYLSGASVALAVDGIYNVATLPNANAGNMYFTTRMLAEWVSTSNVVCTIYWKSAGVTGDAKFTVNLAAKQDSETTALSDTQTVTTTVSTTANKLMKSQVTFLAAVFAAGDWIGLNVSRDPADAADTLASDLNVVQIVLEFTGRG